MKIFGQLCDNGAAKNVTLATTKWSKTTRDEGQKQLANKWINMLGKGSHIAPFMDTHESAWDIVNLIIENEPFDAVLFQKLVDHQKHPPKHQRPRGFFRSLFGGLFGVSASDMFIAFALTNLVVVSARDLMTDNYICA